MLRGLHPLPRDSQCFLAGEPDLDSPTLLQDSQVGKVRFTGLEQYTPSPCGARVTARGELGMAVQSPLSPAATWDVGMLAQLGPLQDCDMGRQPRICWL